MTDIKPGNGTNAAVVAQAMAQATEVATSAGKVASDIEYIKKDITDIKTSIMSILKEFVERREFDEQIRTLQTQIAELKKSLSDRQVNTVLIVIGSTVMSSVLTFLIIAFLQSKR